MNMQVDTSRLMRAINIHRRIRKDRTYSYITNRAIQNVIGHAFAPTPKADSNKIAWQMGQVSTKIAYVTRKGEWKRYKKPKKVYQFDDTLAARIVNARRRDSGKPMIFGKEMEENAKRLIAYKLRSVAFIKSGWIPAYNHFSRAIGRPTKYKGDGRVYGVPKGGATPAPKGTAVTVATAWNNARAAGKIGFAALQTSTNYVVRNMIEWATDELRKGARAAGFRVR